MGMVLVPVRAAWYSVRVRAVRIRVRVWVKDFHEFVQFWIILNLRCESVLSTLLSKRKTIIFPDHLLAVRSVIFWCSRPVLQVASPQGAYIPKWVYKRSVSRTATFPRENHSTWTCETFCQICLQVIWPSLNRDSVPVVFVQWYQYKPALSSILG